MNTIKKQYDKVDKPLKKQPNEFHPRYSKYFNVVMFYCVSYSFLIYYDFKSFTKLKIKKVCFSVT